MQNECSRNMGNRDEREKKSRKTDAETGDKGGRKEGKKDVGNDKVCDHSEILLPYKSHL